MSTQLTNRHLDRRRLRARIRRFYQLLNEQNWEKCFTLIDPRLRDAGKVDFDGYAKSLSAFFAAFGPLRNVSVQDLSLHLNVQDNKHDDRDFAYGSVLWEDRDRQIHKLQERWVRAADGRWYSRMVGLV